MPSKKSDSTDSTSHDGKSKNAVAIRAGREMTAFDDQNIPEEHRKEIDELVGRIKMNRALQLESVHETGRDLIRLKELVGHGNFLARIEREFGMSDRTARNYMEVARQPVGKMATVSNLDLRTVYALVAKSTPEEIRNELFRRAEAGATITNEEVKGRIAASKARKKSAALAEKVEPKDDIQGRDSFAGARNDQDSELIGKRTKTNDEAPDAIGKSPAAEVLRALLDLAYDIQENSYHPGPPSGRKTRPHCDPYGVARLLMEGDYERHRMDLWKCFEFIDDVKLALFGMEALPVLRSFEATRKLGAMRLLQEKQWT